MKCPNCSHEWIPSSADLASEMGRKGGSQTSRKKARAAKRNAKLGGWPKGKKRGKRKPDANQIAHGVVAKAEKLTDKELWLLIKEAAKKIPRGVRQQGPPPQRLKVLPSLKSPKRAR